MTQPNQSNDLPKPTYSNLEIVNMVILALAYGSPDKVKGKFEDSIIVRSWKALEDTFENGRKHGYEQGYRAAKAEAMAAEDAAGAATYQVIEGLCRTVWKRVE
ncbi:MAG: hypothetical protein A3J49_03305 [Gallionellales bacterium RIFCSPHIGHO2_02_FULL_57_16]|nr:MAG: hypothetical protein A3J49_03305 [Gallionellales bacterium RIFCSPHIGHO2_02_FULL_57_16]